MLLAMLKGIEFCLSSSNYFLEYEFKNHLALLMNSISVDKLFQKCPSQLSDRKNGLKASLCAGSNSSKMKVLRSKSEI